MHASRNTLPLPFLAAATALAVAAVLACCAGIDQPPRQTGSPSVIALAQNYGLVDLGQEVPSIAIELRYGTPHNASNTVLYPADMPCLVRPGVARKLAIAQAYLEQHGLGLKIWDAYRPPETQEQLWELSGKKSNYVGNPAKGWSAHCCGVAVDVTLVDSVGNELAMPTDFDVLGLRAHAIYTGSNGAVRDRMRLLHKAMEAAKMQFYHREWWHFSDADYSPLGKELVVFGHRIGLRLPGSTPAM